MVEEKLQEVSVSLSLTHYLVLKGTAGVLEKSLSGLIREAVYDLFEEEIWGLGAIYGKLLEEAGLLLTKSPRDSRELEDPREERQEVISVELADLIIDEITNIQKEAEEEADMMEAIAVLGQQFGGN